ARVRRIGKNGDAEAEHRTSSLDGAGSRRGYLTTRAAPARSSRRRRREHEHRTAVLGLLELEAEEPRLGQPVDDRPLLRREVSRSRRRRARQGRTERLRELVLEVLLAEEEHVLRR